MLAETTVSEPALDLVVELEAVDSSTSVAALMHLEDLHVPSKAVLRASSTSHRQAQALRSTQQELPSPTTPAGLRP